MSKILESTYRVGNPFNDAGDDGISSEIMKVLYKCEKAKSSAYREREQAVSYQRDFGLAFD